VVPYQAFRTQDGDLVVAVFAEKFWSGFCRAIERPEWIDDPRFDSNPKRVARRAELTSLLEAIFPARTTAEWLGRLHAAGVPAAPIQTVADVLSDPQVLLREMVVDLDHPRLGILRTLGTPVRSAGAPPFRPAAPPALGEHTDAILGGLLGYPLERLQALRRRGIIR
jgi:formyl-CoA transferase